MTLSGPPRRPSDFSSLFGGGGGGGSPKLATAGSSPATTVASASLQSAVVGGMRSPPRDGRPAGAGDHGGSVSAFASRTGSGGGTAAVAISPPRPGGLSVIREASGAGFSPRLRPVDHDDGAGGGSGTPAAQPPADSGNLRQRSTGSVSGLGGLSLFPGASFSEGAHDDSDGEDHSGGHHAGGARQTTLKPAELAKLSRSMHEVFMASADFEAVTRMVNRWVQSWLPKITEQHRTGAVTAASLADFGNEVAEVLNEIVAKCMTHEPYNLPEQALTRVQESERKHAAAAVSAAPTDAAAPHGRRRSATSGTAVAGAGAGHPHLHHHSHSASASASAHSHARGDHSSGMRRSSTATASLTEADAGGGGGIAAGWADGRSSPAAAGGGSRSASPAVSSLSGGETVAAFHAAFVNGVLKRRCGIPMAYLAERLRHLVIAARVHAGAQELWQARDRAVPFMAALRRVTDAALTASAASKPGCIGPLPVADDPTVARMALAWGLYDARTNALTELAARPILGASGSAGAADGRAPTPAAPSIADSGPHASPPAAVVAGDREAALALFTPKATSAAASAHGTGPYRAPTGSDAELRGSPASHHVSGEGVGAHSSGAVPRAGTPGSAVAPYSATPPPIILASDAAAPAAAAPRRRTVSHVSDPPPRKASLLLEVPREAQEYLRDQWERYIVTSFQTYVLATAPEDVAADAAIARRFRRLAWLSPAQMDVPEVARQPLVLRTAAQELRAMSTRGTPQEKMDCMLNSVKLLSRAMQQAAKRKSGALAAVGNDDLLPAIIFVTMLAAPTQFASNLAYVERFRHPDARNYGHAGHCFMNFQGASQYIADMLNGACLRPPMDEWEFTLRCDECEAGRVPRWIDSVEGGGGGGGGSGGGV
jgi:hypothetical protein